MDGTVAERALVFLLRLGGVVLLLAWLAVFLPTDWMAECHRWLGLGAFPRAPLTEYLTRSISGLYAIHGGMLLVLSSNVRRYQPIIRYVACTTAVFGLVLLGVDWRARLPLYWTVGEGPPLAALGVVLWSLTRALPQAAASGRERFEPDAAA